MNPMNKSRFFLIFIILVGFLLRLLPLGFPTFNAEEVRIAVRGYTLAKFGTDELGRKYPYLFNSSEDYQLPVTSYLTAIGSFIFGKTDLGARLPFVLIGTLLILSMYRLSNIIFFKKKISIYTTIVVCFSPGLIFFSKFPNEFIIAALLLTILLIILLSEKINKTFFLLIICLMLLTSKIFWFTLIPIILFTLIINKKIGGHRTFIGLSTITLNLFILILFINIPQGVRSLIENNFFTINDITVKNGIERLRSQNLSYWPPFLDKILFSKAHILIAGLCNWMSHFQLSILFAQLDKNGMYGFFNIGAFPKTMMIPFFVGLFTVFKDKKDKSTYYLIIFIILLTYPLLFLYPNINIGYIILIIPMISLLISKGFMNINSKISYFILFFSIFEILMNYFFISSTIKNSSNLRPVWIRQVVNDLYDISLKNKVYISDNSINGVIPFIEWYTPIIKTVPYYKNVNFPYKFFEGEIVNIKTIGSSNRIVECSDEEEADIFATKRDIDKLTSIEKIVPINTYKDDLGKEVLFFLKTNKCIK